MSMLLRYLCHFNMVALVFLLFAAIFGFVVPPATADRAEDEAAIAATNALKGKLIFTHVIYRHGDRMPIKPYPKDPYRDRKNWPANFGELSNLGKMQHYHLGQWLRQRYNSLLNVTYSNDEIYIRSTDVDRTLMSAQANLAGLFPPVNDEVWNEKINWQPIPVHTTEEHFDAVLGAKAPCPSYEYAYSELLNSPEFQKIYERYGYLFNYLSSFTGLKVQTLEAVQALNNTLFIEDLYNKTLPDWTKKVYPSADMTYVASFNFKVYTYTRKLARLKVGPLIKDILDRFMAKSSGTLKPDRSMYMYSGHDMTVANLLNGLKLFDVHSPPYTACILMELRVDEQRNPFVSIFYKNSSAEPMPMDIPGCGVSCPLLKMFSLYKDVIPNDWSEECVLSTLMMTYEEANVGLAMGILVAIISAMLFVTYITMMVYRRRRYRIYSAYTQVA